nr:ras-related protein Rab-40B isoform X2 [Misgurnus anguillicaudatus]
MGHRADMKMNHRSSPAKAYDFLLKFLLVGDSDVGKGEILASLQDGSSESPYGYNMGIDYKTTTILLDGRRVKLQLWDTSGQGRFCTIFRSYSRGAQGVILVYDITNRWSFDGIDRWIKEIDEHAPGVPKILVGNRLHLAYKRQVTTEHAQAFAERLGVTFFEVSPLCNFNITESFTELARIVLMRHGMERLWRPNKDNNRSKLITHGNLDAASHFDSVESAGPVLSFYRVLHSSAPRGQASPSCCLKKPPKVLLHGQRSQCQDDARSFLLCHSQQC